MNISVGKDKVSFRVPVDIKCKVSPVLWDEITPNRKKIHLPDEAPHIFDLCVEWLYTRSLYSRW